MQIDQIALIFFVILCVLPLLSSLIVLFIIFVLGRRFWQNTIDPNVERLLARYEHLRQTQPDQPAEKHIQDILHREAIKCGIIGALTGLGGFFTLPIALPLDMLLSTRIQTTMVQFTARAYGLSDDRHDTRWATHFIMARGAEVSRISADILLRYMLRFVGKSLSKMIPLVGALMSFAVNYALARATARLALAWYRRQSPSSAQ